MKREGQVVWSVSMEDHARFIERLLALILLETMRDSTLGQKAVRLRTAGLANVQIAQLLETSAQVVTQLLYLARSRRAPRNATGRKRKGKNLERKARG